MKISSIELSAPMAIENIKILGAVLELPAKHHCQFSQYQENGPNGLNWQCCLAGSSKTAPRIFIFSMAMGADYTFELISIEVYAPQFIGHNKLFLASVSKEHNVVIFVTYLSFLFRVSETEGKHVDMSSFFLVHGAGFDSL